MKVYKTKISNLVILILVVMFVYYSYAFLSRTFNFFDFILFLMLPILIIYNIAKTEYKIHNNTLHITSGFIVNKKIPVSNIRKIEEIHSILSAPAASFDRLELIYNKFDSIMISPKNKSDFIDDLLKINPNIKVDRKRIK